MKPPAAPAAQAEVPGLLTMAPFESRRRFGRPRGCTARSSYPAPPHALTTATWTLGLWLCARTGRRCEADGLRGARGAAARPTGRASWRDCTPCISCILMGAAAAAAEAGARKERATGWRVNQAQRACACTVRGGPLACAAMLVRSIFGGCLRGRRLQRLGAPQRVASYCQSLKVRDASRRPRLLATTRAARPQATAGHCATRETLHAPHTQPNCTPSCCPQARPINPSCP
jgi:hypothetical protein